MNSFVRKLVWGALCVLSIASVAHAQNLPNSTQGNGASSNPYNSPIHRANPNSRQGTVPSTPPSRAPNIAPPVRQPTLENGGIGNGQPNRQAPSRPSTQTPDPQRSK
ncbi:hypothetical protein BZK31_17165 [Pseudomonas floridensis]|uniref:Lipoprotein n=1 Tax=Pseudomonas floridensis TaxID=1958950 RepID=A0A1X0N534_9PSED|nr:hypothetical protein [Pseudomonas floridensis]ORC58012.1 hypothetical protein BZK31_17165 [Pseudomonas floridensis]